MKYSEFDRNFVKKQENSAFGGCIYLEKGLVFEGKFNEFKNSYAYFKGGGIYALSIL